MAKRKNKNIAWILALIAVGLFAFRKKATITTVSVSDAQPIKNADADFLALLKDGAKLLASDLKYVYKQTSGNVYADGFYSQNYNDYYIIRLFGDTNKYYVSISDIQSIS